MKNYADNKQFKNTIQAIGILGLVCLLGLYRCPFRFIFGISCPGCGMTRACLALLKMDFDEALYYHPGVFMFALFALLWLLDLIKIIRLSQRMKKLGVIVFGVVMIGIYVVRLVNGSPLVTMHFDSSLLGKIAKTLRRYK